MQQIEVAMHISNDPISRSVQAMNDLNQKIVDAHQSLSGKLLNMAVTEKVGSEKQATAAQALVDYRA